MSDQAIMTRLSKLHPQSIDLSLNRIENLLEGLGRPQDNLPPVIHVAGTNGKGSTVALLRAIAEAAGFRVHAYTSPHLVDFNERIRVAGTQISDQALNAAIDECEEANFGNPITFFEFTTAVALHAFSKTPADLTLLEVGLGGRLDATNVVAKPALSVITPIGIDHVEYLGHSLESIAAEKAGIIKQDVPVITAIQDKRVMKVIEDKAAALNSKLFQEGKHWKMARERARMVFKTGSGMRDLPMPRLLGDHQIQNAGIAIASFDAIGTFPTPDAAISSGMLAAEWPARLQRLTHGPLIQNLAPGWELWLDGGHNAMAGEALAAQAQRWSDQSLHVVFGMLNNKDAQAFLMPLVPHIKELYGVALKGEENALSAEEATSLAKSVGIPSIVSSGIETALARIPRQQAKPGRILICGSLRLAGQVLNKNR